MVSETAKQIPVSVWMRRIAAALLMISYIPFVAGVVQVAVVPAKYLWIVLPLYGLVTAGVVWVLLVSKYFTSHKGRLVAMLVCATLLGAANVAGYMTVRATENLFGGVQDARTEYVEYVVVAKKSNQGVQVDTAQGVAVVANDPLHQANTEALALETPAAQQPHETLAESVEALRTEAVQLVSMRRASLQLIRDNYADFYADTVVLATYRVKDTVRQDAAVDVSQPFAVYISGIDTYGEVSTVSRSDVNMLAVVNPQSRQMLLVNTPRDYYVQLHGTTGSRDKLTHAGLYGVDMSRKTVEDLYGVQVPFYVRINFTSLVSLVDTIGPIEVYSDYSFKGFKEGYNTLGSKEALEFARERYSFEAGDRQRGRNQQRVIEAIIAKLNKPQNAVHMAAVLDTAKGSVETNMSEAAIKQLIRMQLDDMKAWSVESIAVDGTGAMQPTYSMGAQPLYVMVPDERSLGEARQRIADTLQAK